MWFLEISLGSINDGSEPPCSVSFLFLPLFVHFLALRLSNQIPLESLGSRGWLEMAGKRVLPKCERKIRSPQPSTRGRHLPACFRLRLHYTQGKERARKYGLYIVSDLCPHRKQFMCCFLGTARCTQRFANAWSEGPDGPWQHQAFLPISLVTVPVVHLQETTWQDGQRGSLHIPLEADAPWSSSPSLHSWNTAATSASLRNLSWVIRELDPTDHLLPLPFPAVFLLTSKSCMCLAGQRAVHAHLELPGQLAAAATANGCVLEVPFHRWGLSFGFLFPLSSCKPSGNLWEFCSQRSY